jgi:hypothetical protein
LGCAAGQLLSVDVVDEPRAARLPRATDALALLEKLGWFDETQREQQRAYYRVALAGIAPL